jgi:hypothetical protein
MGNEVVASFHSSRSDSHFSPFGLTDASYKGKKIVVRAHATFAHDVDDKAIPELLLSLAVFQYIDRNGVGSSYNMWSALCVNVCPVQ